MAIPFVGKRMTRAEFETYLRSLKFGAKFKPSFVTLHHTAAPTLAQRPLGFTAQHLQNLKHYYETTMGWSGAPHVFIDDQEDGIIVFQRMDMRGVHAASFNRDSWGVEMLGFYDIESFHTGRGAKVKDNTMHALAIMCNALKKSPSTIKFHRDDPQTSKTCPGNNVTKRDVVADVSKLMSLKPPQDMVDKPNETELVLPNGQIWENTRHKENRLMVRARDFLTSVDSQSKFAVSRLNLTWTHKAGTFQIPIAEIDEAGSSWVYVRDVANTMGWIVAIKGYQVTLT